MSDWTVAPEAAWAMLTQLIQILPPPPGRPRSIDWADVARRLGVELPASYRALIDVYGPGCIDDFLWLYSPDASNSRLNLLGQAEDELDALRAVRGDRGHEILGGAIHPAPEAVPYPIHPEPGGLIPWAGTDNGDTVYWEARGPSTEWRVIVTASRLGNWCAFDGPETEWLIRVLGRQERVPFFPDDFPSPTLAFAPAPSDPTPVWR